MIDCEVKFDGYRPYQTYIKTKRGSLRKAFHYDWKREALAIVNP